VIDSPPLRWTGGKWNLAPWIISHFPLHGCYVEPFCGSAAILFRKQPSDTEVVNDLNEEILNFFDILRNQSDDLVKAIDLTPYSRAELKRSKSIDSNLSPLERARRFYVRVQQSFVSGGGDRKSAWRFQINDQSLINRWNKTSHLWECAYRLKHVQLECDTAAAIIDRFDHENTLYYVDPPYLHSTRTAKNDYQFEMTDNEHVALAAQLNAVKGMVVLSGYNSPLYCDLYQGWRCVSMETDTVQKSKRIESLWISPKAQSRKFQREMFGEMS
jgi:DNA adenine methylase